MAALAQATGKRSNLKRFAQAAGTDCRLCRHYQPAKVTAYYTVWHCTNRTTDLGYKPYCPNYAGKE
jgi:hypothetical protein